LEKASYTYRPYTKIKKMYISIVLFCLLFTFAGMGRVAIALPFLFILLLDFFLNIKDGKISYIKENIYSKQLSIIILYGFLTLIWSPNKEEALSYLFYLILVLIVSVIFYYYILKFELFNLLISIVFIFSLTNYLIIFFPSLFGFLGYDDPTGFVTNGWSIQFRFMGMNDNPNMLAIFMIYSIFITFHVIKNFKLNNKLKFFLNINLILAILAIFLTQSKKGMLFSAILFSFYFLLNFSFSKLIKVAMTIALILIIGLQIPVVKNSIDKSFKRFELMLKVVDGTNKSADRSTKERFDFIEKGIDGFVENPIFGHGINSFIDYLGHPAHNNYVELLYGIGIIGFSIYYFIHIKLLKRLFEASNQYLMVIFILLLILMDFGFVALVSKTSMFMLISCDLISKNILQKNNEFKIRK
jgi:O-antigen ligase